MLLDRCPYCDGAALSPAYRRGDGRAIVRCGGCDLLFIPDVPEDLSTLYGPAYFEKPAAGAADSLGYASYSSLGMMQFRWQPALLRLFEGPRAHHGAALLDLGCATGLFLYMASACGFGCTGLEISAAAAATCRQRGLQVIEAPLEQAPLAGFDVITGWDFIEHLPDLRAAFQKIRGALREGGCFLFSTPDAGASRVLMLGDRWINFTSSLEHLTYLTRPFLERALRETFGEEAALLAFDVGTEWTNLVGLVRRGGLTARDRRVARLLEQRAAPEDEAELRELGAELFWFYLMFEQEAAALRVLAVSEGVLPERVLHGMRAGLHYKQGRLAEALPLLQEAVKEDPWLSEWVLHCERQRARDLAQVMDAQGREFAAERVRLEQQRSSLELRQAQVNSEAQHLRSTLDQLHGSVTWKIGRGITSHISEAALNRWQRLPAQDRAAPLKAASRTVQHMARRGLERLLRRPALPGREDAPGRPTPAAPAASAPARPAAPEASADPALSRHRCLPLVSVILPVYNQTDMLRSSVESVLAQSYPHLEIVVLDDGSREDVEAVLAGLLDLPAVRLYRQPNQKLPRALSHAFQYARGELHTWTSADNLMEPHAIARLVDALLLHPEAVLAYADVRLIDDAGQPLTDGSYRPQNLDPAAPDVVRLYRSDRPLAAERDNYINACFLYRRSAAEALGRHYADDLRGAEDYDFWLRLQRCGRLLHIGNAEPLYAYRVHQRSMSHELVTQEREHHHSRVLDLVCLDAERQAYARRRWGAELSPTLADAERALLRGLLEQLPVDITVPLGADAPGRKRLPFGPPGSTSTAPVSVRVLPDRYQLLVRPPQPGAAERVIELPRGVEVSPLAYKARDVRADPRNLPEAARGRPVFACHLPLGQIALDVERMRRVMLDNPWAYFAFIDVAGQEPAWDGRALVREIENAGLWSPLPLGSPYGLYACFDWLLLPPVTAPLPEARYREALALAYAVGRPLVRCDAEGALPAPYQLGPAAGETALGFCAQLRKDGLDPAVLDAYLDAWSPLGCLRALLQHADAASQDFAVPRPQFTHESAPPPVAPPQPVLPARLSAASLRATLLVDSLDVGGLEEVVAFLATQLGRFGVRAAVACAQRGGHVAERLLAQGFEVRIADGDPARLLQQLRALQPDVINTHFASLPAVEAAATLGRPIVETIHNTYVWLDAERWQEERRRSRSFAAALAVSAAVKRYYEARNPDLPPARITTVGNAIAPGRVRTVPRAEARRALQIPEDALLFLSLGRYCYQKNQLGLLRGFAQLAARCPDAYLLFMGSAPEAERPYMDSVRRLQGELPCAARVRLEPFHSDVSAVLSAADALVLDSYYEGWSLAGTEALCAGTPLIHSQCGSAEELCGPGGERGLIIENPGGPLLDLDVPRILETAVQPTQVNHAGLVAAMERIARERALWRGKRDAIAGYASRVFHPDAVLLRYARAFHEVNRS